MENLIILKLKKRLKLKDRFLMRIFKRTAVKIYKIGVEQGLNATL